MKKTTFVGILLLLVSFPAISQTLISLKGKKVSVKQPQFYISEIIDSRSEKEVLGIVQRGLNNKQEAALFEAGLQIEFKHCLGKYFQPEQELLPLTMRVLKLSIFERTLITSETAIAELIVEFYQKTNEGFVLVKSAASTITSFGFDVTSSHDRNIAESVKNCLDQVNATLHNRDFLRRNTYAVPYEKLSNVPDILNQQDYPILNKRPLAKGVYRNFIEFRENAPGITGFSFKEKSNPLGEQYDVTRGVIKSKGDVLDNVWGYCDGKHLFIKVGEEFVQVQDEDGILWFEGYDISDVKTQVHIPGKAIMMAAFTGYFFYQLRTTFNSKTMRYVINLGNGDLFPLD